MVRKFKTLFLLFGYCLPGNAVKKTLPSSLAMPLMTLMLRLKFPSLRRFLGSSGETGEKRNKCYNN